jgi:hypothetical protein
MRIDLASGGRVVTSFVPKCMPGNIFPRKYIVWFVIALHSYSGGTPLTWLGIPI